ncbi:MAG: serine/threonine-protein kinase, partial [Pseudomonadota bacterium]
MRQPIPFGRYLLLERISVGGMAEVFRAKSFGAEGFEKIVAVKRILPSIAEDGDFIQMFIDEAKIAGQLTHANICQIIELGKVGESYFIAMEFVWGKDVLQIYNRLKRLGQRLNPVMAAAIAANVCAGLDFAHRKKDQWGRPLNIIHRDVSPQNVLVSYEGEVKLIDFGIAKAATRSSKTKAGVLKGKFGYMSPEQVRGLPIDRRSDLFAVGTILYEMVTAERLFSGECDFLALEKVRNADIQPPSFLADNVPPALESVILRALARDVEERYQWAGEMQEDLLTFLKTTDPSFNAKRLSYWMREVFAAELERERQVLEKYKMIRWEEAALSQASDEQLDRGAIGDGEQADGELHESQQDGRLRQRLRAGAKAGRLAGVLSAAQDGGEGGSASAEGIGSGGARAGSRGRGGSGGGGGGGGGGEHDDDLIDGSLEHAFDDQDDETLIDDVSISSRLLGDLVSPDGRAAASQDQGKNPAFGGGESNRNEARDVLFPADIVAGAAGPSEITSEPMTVRAPGRATGPVRSVGAIEEPSPTYSAQPASPLVDASSAVRSVRMVGPPPAAPGPGMAPLGSTPGLSVAPLPSRQEDKEEPPRKKWYRSVPTVAAAIGLVLLVLGVVAFGYYRLRLDGGATRPLPAGTILVAATDTEAAEIWIDGARRGSLAGGDHLKIEGLAPGSYEIRARRPGAIDYVQTVELRPDGTELVMCRFQAARQMA